MANLTGSYQNRFFSGSENYPHGSSSAGFIAQHIDSAGVFSEKGTFTPTYFQGVYKSKYASGSENYPHASNSAGLIAQHIDKNSVFSEKGDYTPTYFQSIYFPATASHENEPSTWDVNGGKIAFICEDDATPPTLSDQDPTPNSINNLVCVDPNFIIDDAFQCQGGPAGIPLNTVNVWVNSGSGGDIPAVVSGVIVANFNGLSSSIENAGATNPPHGWKITLDPYPYFPYDTIIVVSMEAYDSQGNYLSSSYSFRTEGGGCIGHIAPPDPNIKYRDDYTITGLSSSVFERRTVDGCPVDQAPLVMGTRGARSLRMCAPYTVEGGNVKQNGETRYPLGKPSTCSASQEVVSACPPDPGPPP